MLLWKTLRDIDIVKFEIVSHGRRIMKVLMEFESLIFEKCIHLMVRGKEWGTAVGS